MLYRYADSGDERLRRIAGRTLEVMQTRGLHDHLQGGFFRYCTDREWRIPHFEKMLYDQALLLWSYALGARVLGRDDFRHTAQSVYRCLEETFAEDGLYVSGHDADTDHVEGGTYLWDRAEIHAALEEGEAELFEDIYAVTEGGNFEGKNHLLRAREPTPAEAPRLRRIEEKLLRKRRERRQPAVDRKVLTGWNALAGAALVHAHRLIGLEEGLERAEELFAVLMQRHAEQGAVYHSSLDGEVQRQEFLSDYAALSLLAGMLEEETGEYSDVLAGLDTSMEAFRHDGGWLESRNDDFMPVPAERFDSPTPSTISLARMSRLRVEMLTGRDYRPLPFGRPLVEDFSNLAALVSRGYFHVIETPTPLAWTRLPPHTVQIPAERETHCYRGVCTPGVPEFS
jgi:hypothetical protein